MIQAAVRKNSAEPAYLVVKNEQEFYSYIEDRLRDEGFEILETSPEMDRSQCLSAQAY
jgi:DNA replication initiation complex subunit (GINS family)